MYVDFSLVFKDNVLYKIAIINKLVNFEQIHSIPLLLLLDDICDLGEQLLKLRWIDLFFVIIYFVKDLVCHLLLRLFVFTLLFLLPLSGLVRPFCFLLRYFIHGHIKQLLQCLLLVVIVFL